MRDGFILPSLGQAAGLENSLHFVTVDLFIITELNSAVNGPCTVLDAEENPP